MSLIELIEYFAYRSSIGKRKEAEEFLYSCCHPLIAKEIIQNVSFNGEVFRCFHEKTFLKNLDG